MSKHYSDRVMRFRRGVYGNRRQITPGCQLLLLRLSDSMDAKAIVSVPRSALAVDLDAVPARITEWIAEAKAAGFLSVVKRARPGTTAVYQGLVVLPKRYAPADLRGTPQVSSTEVRPSGPLNEPQRYATEGSQVVQAAVSGQESCGSDANEAPTGAVAGLRLIPGVGWVGR